jgi:hypothetical protein
MESKVSSSEISVSTEEEARQLPPKHSNEPIPLPVGFVPTPTGAFRAHRKTLKATLEPGTPRGEISRLPTASAEAGAIPFPLPLPRGSRVLIWKQDPTVGEIGIRKAFLPGVVVTGPADSRIKVEGLPPVSPNAFGDLIATPGTDAFDAIHTFAVVRQTLTMFQRAWGGAVLPWQWNTGGNVDRLKVYPHAGETMNAYYICSEKALKFFFFNTSAPPPMHKVFTCRSFDIVAHETGHAVLDAMKPNWLLIGQSAQTGGLHESFGDLSAIFLALSQLDQVEAVIAQTKANLHDKTFLADLAEEFGLAIGRPNGLRNADNDFKLSEVGTEVHAISQVFTGAIYDVLADIFAWERRPGKQDDAVTLQHAAQYLLGLVLRALNASPASNASFANVANNMLNLSLADGKPQAYRNFIRNRFTLREVIVAPLPLAEEPDVERTFEAIAHEADHGTQNRQGCCGTMTLPEYLGSLEEIDEEYRELKKAVGGKGRQAAE